MLYTVSVDKWSQTVSRKSLTINLDQCCEYHNIVVFKIKIKSDSCLSHYHEFWSLPHCRLQHHDLPFASLVVAFKNNCSQAKGLLFWPITNIRRSFINNKTCMLANIEACITDTLTQSLKSAQNKINFLFESSFRVKSITKVKSNWPPPSPPWVRNVFDITAMFTNNNRAIRFLVFKEGL